MQLKIIIIVGKGFFIYSKDVCQRLQKNNEKLICIDGSEIIINSLSDDEIGNLINGQRLPKNIIRI